MTIIFLIFYGIAFGILSAIVASNKKRDMFNWFLIGFLFGIFGFIAILVLEKNEQDHNLNSKTKKEFDPVDFDKKCPDCAETIKLEAKVCRYCNYRFSERELKKEITDKRTHFFEESQLITCDNCFRLNNPKAEHCHDCGKNLFGPKSQRITCDNCYSFNDPKAENCYNCGKNLP